MRFPLPSAPFDTSVALAPSIVEQLERLIQQTLSKALVEYEAYHQNPRRALPPSQYKLVKRVEHLVCYRERVKAGPAASATFSASAPCKSNVTDTTSHPSKLVTIGTIIGTLDDAMYGLLATDVTSTFMRASYTHEELLDSELLYCIEAPRPDQPFTFCGVKWHVLELSKVTTKRDFLYVEASGIVMRDGQRVGYHIRHSVDLPGLGALSLGHAHVLRAHLVSCNLFRQLANNKVDVYMTGSVNLNGHVPTAVATAFTATALLKLGQAIECARSKKLAYLVEQQQWKRYNGKAQGSGDTSAITLLKSHGSSTPCAVCAAALHVFRSVAHCELCLQAVCSRCRVTRRLSYRVARPKELHHRNTVFCTACVAKGVTYSAIDVARAELTGRTTPTSLSSGQLRRLVTSSLASTSTCAISASAYTRQDGREASSWKRASLVEYQVPVRKRSLTLPCVAPDTDNGMERLDRSETTLVVTSSTRDDMQEDGNGDGRTKTLALCGIADHLDVAPRTNSLASSMPPRLTASAIESQRRRQLEWMRRMKELWQNAESVYQYTRKNTDSMGCGHMVIRAHSLPFPAIDVATDLD
ncbi:hypothetical protein PsorP6_017357 [Peronosclerospora sorghi]|uniref:Uncharacterized protein n=1 Tax=Peronosclerospora sorghi TaxID=230839 RepID=A0ACC0WL90_9STRA|nr:hypothetical protein PsorP6_017357 [Peronosclerospora sorghi]